jgi:peptide chain release factor 3
MPLAVRRVPLLGAVGPLQFEVVQHRLKSEYGAESRLEQAPFQNIRWMRRKDGGPVVDATVQLPTDMVLARDAVDTPTLLFGGTWGLRLFTERNPDLELY